MGLSENSVKKEHVDIEKHVDIGHRVLFHTRGVMGGNMRQRHATLAFLSLDMRHQDPLSRASLYSRDPHVNLLLIPKSILFRSSPLAKYFYSEE